MKAMSIKAFIKKKKITKMFVENRYISSLMKQKPQQHFNGFSLWREKSHFYLPVIFSHNPVFFPWGSRNSREQLWARASGAVNCFLDVV